MLGLFYYTVPFIAVLTVVVFFHELGHYLVGRWCGAGVDAFSIGFGPELWHHVDRHGTRWRVAAVPLGGYVKFHGDANAASVPDGQAIAEMAPEERAGALASLSVWRRAAIVAAGPVANFLLALVLIAGLFHFSGKLMVHPSVLEISANSAAAKSDLRVGDLVLSIDGRPVDKSNALPQSVLSDMTIVVQRDGVDRTITLVPTNGPAGLGVKAGVRPEILEILPDSAAAKSDLKAGDVVLAVDGHPVDSVDQLPKLIKSSISGSIALVVKRDGRMRTVDVVPHREFVQTPEGKKPTATLGIKIEPAKEHIEMRHLGPAESVRAAGEQIWSIVTTTARTIKQLVVGQESVKQLSGPIGIAQVSGEAAQAGVVPIISLVAILSVSIGLLNLLPIPLLDGGFLMFFAYEAIRGKALPERAQMMGFRIGLTFVAVLSIFVAFNDISKIIVGQLGHAARPQAETGQKTK